MIERVFTYALYLWKRVIDMPFKMLKHIRKCVSRICQYQKKRFSDEEVGDNACIVSGAFTSIYLMSRKSNMKSISIGSAVMISLCTYISYIAWPILLSCLIVVYPLYSKYEMYLHGSNRKV